MALLFAAIIVAGGTVFGILAGEALRRMLLDNSVRGHFPMRSAYEFVRGPLSVHVAALAAGIFLPAAALFLLLAWSVRRAIDRVIGALRISADRDLSTPTPFRGFEEAARIVGQVDDARAETRDALRAIRTEAEDLAASGAPADEFRLRWDALRQRIRGIAP
jgi:methyl-accepting chemotaxis protein